MKRAYFVCLLLCVIAAFLLSQANPISLINPTAKLASPGVVSSINASQADPQAQARILDGYGKLPLSFEANQGQADARVKFLSRTGGYTLFLTGDEAVLALRGKAKNRRANAVDHFAKSSPQGLKPASLAGVRGTAEQAAEKLRFVSGHRFSDAASSTKSEARLGAGRRDDAATELTTGAVLRMKLRHANPAAKVTGADQLAGTSNYFIGNDPAKWRTNVPTYAKVKYEGIYPGIDLVYYGNQRQLEYDFIVAPGADPRRIAFDVHGARRIRRDVHGDLVLKMSEGEIRWHKPVVYQEKNGTRQEIAAHYAITAANRVGFEVARYDPSRPLYIDPLIYSTYLGGSSNEFGQAIAVDSAGNAYVVGYTESTDFPVTPGAFQAACGNPNPGLCTNAFVSKLNPTGSALVYSTYLGGSGGDLGYGIAVDSAGNAYITGLTNSTDFPVTPGVFQTVCGDPGCAHGDAFVAKLNPTGSALVYSTYLGGSGFDVGAGIAVDSAGNAYVTGGTLSTDFPVTPGAFQTACKGGCVSPDAFVSKLNPTGSALVYSTYLGGSSDEFGLGIAVDSAGDAYLTGETDSVDFPVTPGALQTNLGGGVDGFVTKLNPNGSALVYSTYLGGNSNDGCNGIALDSAGNAYVTGFTSSTDFPITPGAFQTICNPGNNKCANGDAFVSKLNPTGSALVYSTYLGGSFSDFGSGIAVDKAGNAYVTGYTNSSNFPVTPGAFQTLCNGGSNCALYGDAIVTKFNPTGSALFSSTYLGGISSDQGSGIAVDSAGNAYVAGSTDSTNFPTKNPLQPANGGLNDAFVTKIQMLAKTTTALTSSPNPSAYGQAVTFTAVVTSALGAPPDGEIVTFMKGTTVLGTGSLSGGSASFTTPKLKVGTHLIKAVYGGDSDFAASSKEVKQVVTKATTTTTLVSSQNPSNFGQAVTFTASVAPQFSGVVTGSVTFYDGTTALKTVSLSGGVAKFTTSTLAQGTHTITATYNGNASFIGSSASLTQTVN